MRQWNHYWTRHWDPDERVAQNEARTAQHNRRYALPRPRRRNAPPDRPPNPRDVPALLDSLSTGLSSVASDIASALRRADHSLSTGSNSAATDLANARAARGQAERPS